VSSMHMAFYMLQGHKPSAVHFGAPCLWLPASMLISTACLLHDSLMLMPLQEHRFCHRMPVRS
jgi:hypothetical protein